MLIESCARRVLRATLGAEEPVTALVPPQNSPSIPKFFSGTWDPLDLTPQVTLSHHVSPRPTAIVLFCVHVMLSAAFLPLPLPLLEAKHWRLFPDLVHTI